MLGPSSNVGKMFNDSSAPAAKAATAKSSGGNPMSGISNMAGGAMKGLESWGEHEALPYIGNFFGGMF